MPLPTPTLDDRSFQDLVDDAKRYIQRRCPEWTNHNVSDPGVALIEAFAWMVEVMLYRVNRIPERVHVRLLELLGLTLRPPAAARVEVDLRLSAPASEVTIVPQGFRVATSQAAGEEPVVFSTSESCSIRPTTCAHVISVHADGTSHSHDDDVRVGHSFEMFTSDPPVDGDAIYFGFPGALDRHMVLFSFVCPDVGSGVGIDVTNPPLRWEASTLSADAVAWAQCEVGEDGTAGFNRTGSITLHVPRQHAATTISGQSAWWIRCVVVEPTTTNRRYRRSPIISSVTGDTVGASVDALHGEYWHGRVLGTSDGTAGQEFSLDTFPIASAVTVEVGTSATQGRDITWEKWRDVVNFGDSGPDDRHFCVDSASGTIRFGPVVRSESGDMQRFGALPPKEATIRVGNVLIGGGSRGNVRAHTLISMPQSFPLVDRVDNRRPAAGGRDGDTIEDLMSRAPLLMRSRGRAVTREDYELLALEVAPELARAHCALDSDTSTATHLCLVPVAAANEMGEIRLGDLAVSTHVLERVRDFLDRRRLVGTRLVLDDTGYVGVSVAASVRRRPTVDRDEVAQAIMRRLNHYLSPLHGGPDGNGWPFERPLRERELHGVVLAVDGVELVDSVALRIGDPRNRQLENPREEIPLRPNALFLPFGHEITVN